MQKFKVQENVPDVYTKFSRDFQLLCNLYDIVYNGVRFDISTMLGILETSAIRESMLPHLQTKLGFFTQERFTSESLREILKGFKEMVKYKGTVVGIQYAIVLYLRAIGKGSAEFIVNIFNASSMYQIDVNIEEDLDNIVILKELLKYVVPSGYRVRVVPTLSTPEYQSPLEATVVFDHAPEVEIVHNNAVYNEDRLRYTLPTSRVSTSGVISLSQGKEIDDEQ